MSSSLLIILALGVGLYLFGCRLGIKQICSMTGQTAPGDTTAPPVDTTGAPPVGIDPTTGQPIPAAPVGLTQQQQLDLSFPRVSSIQAMEYISNQATEDIDKYTYAELGTALKLNIKATLLANYKVWLQSIAEYNDMRLTPLTGRALAKYSEMILDVTRRFNIALNPAATAMFRANEFAGTPMMGTVTASMAKISM
jgi:hypothetical protein